MIVCYSDFFYAVKIVQFSISQSISLKNLRFLLDTIVLSPESAETDSSL